jgi:uncharacterized membrane protein YfcA
LSPEVFLILLGVGAAAGVLSGMFGVGGGIVIVPSLLAVYSLIGFNSPYVVHVAISTSLFTIIFTSTSSSYKHSKHGNVLWLAALFIGLASSTAVFLFSKVALLIHGDMLKKIFAVVLIAVGILMLTEKKPGGGKDEENCEPGNIKKLYCLMIGLLAGTVAAFTGLGGGIFKIPLLHYVAKVPIRKSIGTSAAALFITSLAGVISYIINAPVGADTMKYSIGIVDALSALPIVMASIPMAQVGVYINKKTRSHLLKKLFAGLIMIVALKMLFL